MRWVVASSIMSFLCESMEVDNMPCFSPNHSEPKRLGVDERQWNACINVRCQPAPAAVIEHRQERRGEECGIGWGIERDTLSFF